MPTKEEMVKKIKETFPDIPDEVIRKAEEETYEAVHVISIVEQSYKRYGNSLSESQKRLIMVSSIITMMEYARGRISLRHVNEIRKDLKAEKPDLKAEKPNAKQNALVDRMMHIEFE